MAGCCRAAMYGAVGKVSPRIWLVIVLLLQGACATNPVSGNRELALISEPQEIAMGRKFAAGAEAQLGVVDDPDLQGYVSRLGMQLARVSERPALPWAFQVVDDPTPNAFAAPGGYVFVTRGLLALMRNEAEFVTVLGHEIGHVTARHSVAMMSRAQLAQIGLGVGSILSPTLAQYGQLASSGLQLLFLSYGRDAERQADDLGYGYALGQGYDVREMVNVFAALESSAELAGQSPIPSWLASHPYPAERIQRIEKRLATLPAAAQPRRIGEDEFMTRIDGLMYGENPRNGYFESNRFMHPTLAFRLDLPKGWAMQNLTQVVVAGSPAKDAIIQLTLVEGTRQAAADRFFAQNGVTPGRVATDKLNGLSATRADFQVQTEGGQLAGVVAFVSLAERNYRILAYTPAAKFAGYEQPFRSSIASFGRLTDKTALNRQPDRLEIIHLQRSMTLAQFNQKYPSVVSLDVIRLINQLPAGETAFPAGFSAKRVVR